MAAWLIPALKAVLPHIGTIISAATPVFTKKSIDAATNHNALLQKQISELQSAVSQNAANIKDLAAQLQNTVTALEQIASTAEANLKRVRRFSAAAIILSIAALCTALFIIVSR